MSVFNNDVIIVYLEIENTSIEFQEKKSSI